MAEAITGGEVGGDGECGEGNGGVKLRWTAEEDAVLREQYPSLGIYACHKHLDRTQVAIKSRAAFLGLKRNLAREDLWTREDSSLLQAHYQADGALYCAQRLGRTIPAIRFKAKQLGLSADRAKPVNHYSTLYSPAQLDALDEIGVVYSKGEIGFDRASELRDMVCAGLITEAIDALKSRFEAAA